MEELSIRQIVERCHQGDREAFGLLYDAMENRLRRVCRRYVADGSTVDDLVHDAFLLIFSKIDTLKDTAKAEAWMLAVTRNLALMYAEHRRNDPTVSFEEVRQPLAASAPSALPITYDEILHLVDVLPEGCQRVFRLSVFEGLSHQQIAALLNIEPHTSSSQLFRAKKLLRQALAVLLVCLLAVFLPIGVWQMMKESGQREDRGDSFRVVAFDTVHIRGFSEPTATEREPRCGSGEDVFDTVQIRRVSVATVTAQSTPRPRPLPLKGRGEAQRDLASEWRSLSFGWEALSFRWRGLSSRREALSFRWRGLSSGWEALSFGWEGLSSGWEALSFRWRGLSSERWIVDGVCCIVYSL